MGMALHLGRVYLPHPVRDTIICIAFDIVGHFLRTCVYVDVQDGDNFFWETSTSFCRSRNEPGMNCFYMPFSKCTIQDATANVGK